MFEAYKTGHLANGGNLFTQTKLLVPRPPCLACRKEYRGPRPSRYCPACEASGEANRVRKVRADASKARSLAKPPEQRRRQMGAY